MCLGCAAAAPTGAAVTGVVLLLQKDSFIKEAFDDVSSSSTPINDNMHAAWII
jgi:hypothetical protein